MIETNIWRHVAVTLDTSSGQIKVYVDGIELPIVAQESLTPEAEGFQSIIYVGSSSAVGPNPGIDAKIWDGLIDEVQLYNRILSQVEIQSIYNYQPISLIKAEAMEAVIIQK